MVKKRLSALIMVVVLLVTLFVSDYTCVPVYAGAVYDEYAIGKDIVGTIVDSMWQGFKGGYNAVDAVWDKIKTAYVDLYNSANDTLDTQSPESPIKYDPADKKYIITQDFSTFMDGCADDHMMDGYYLMEPTLSGSFSKIVWDYFYDIFGTTDPPIRYYRPWKAWLDSPTIDLSTMQFIVFDPPDDKRHSALYCYCFTRPYSYISGGSVIGNSGFIITFDTNCASYVEPEVEVLPFSRHNLYSYSQFLSFDSWGSPFMLFYNEIAQENFLNEGKTYVPSINIPLGGVKVDLGELRNLFPDISFDTSGMSEPQIQKMINDTVQKVVDNLPKADPADPSPTPIDPTPTPIDPTPTPIDPSPPSVDVDLSGVVKLLEQMINDNRLNFAALIKAVQDSGVDISGLTSKQLDEIIKLVTSSGTKLDAVISALSGLGDAVKANDDSELLQQIIDDNGTNFAALIKAVKEGGVNVGDMTSKQLDELVKLITDTNVKLDKAVSSLSGLSFLASNAVDLLDRIIADNSTNFDKLIKAVLDSGVSPEDVTSKQLDKLIELVTESNDKLDTVVDKLNAILLAINVNTAADLLGNLFSRFRPLADKAKQKFPLSIPWDVALVVGFLAHEPELPSFDLPLNLERFGVSETLHIDLARFAPLSKASRAILSITFVLFLIILTRNLFGGDDNG